MKKILIVEDQPELRLLVRATLEEEGVEILECANADEGWREALRLSPDLIVLDIMMPGQMDGLQLCRRLKTTAATQRAKVVLISARGHRNDMAIGKDAGADDYLMKPFSPARLRDVVERLLMPA
jgi:DNA-binding response OmpR family regulator